MKKRSQSKTLFNTDLSVNIKQETDKTQTTNVNILLNRVRQDQKRDLKKRLIFLSLLVLAISSTLVFVLI